MTNEFSRREFLRHIAVVSSAAVLVPMALDEAKAAPQSYLPAGNVRDFVPGVYHLERLSNGMVIQVRRTAAKQIGFEALSARCTHKGCTVLWEIAQKQFRCPCHGGRYDANGKNIAGPPPLPLPKLATKVVKGVVMVKVA